MLKHKKLIGQNNASHSRCDYVSRLGGKTSVSYNILSTILSLLYTLAS